MKDKLRELAERWKRYADDEDSQAEKDGAYIESLRICAEELINILDAEGDGGVVAWMAEDDAALSARVSGRMGGMNDGTRLVSFKELKQGDYRHVFPLYTHPARSGVVSDGQWELIRKTLMYINAAYILGADASPKAISEWRKWLTAALPENQQHAAIAQEKQS